jgi:hypothetical protein
LGATTFPMVPYQRQVFYGGAYIDNIVTRLYSVANQ